MDSGKTLCRLELEIVRSITFEIGKAGEHLVCCDLICQGFYAFLAEPGYPYDVCVDTGNDIKKVQVKSVRNLVDHQTAANIYRFRLYPNTRRRPSRVFDIDYYAFVALDIKMIAYIPVESLTNAQGRLIGELHLRSPFLDYANDFGRYMNDYSVFPERRETLDAQYIR